MSSCKHSVIFDITTHDAGTEVAVKSLAQIRAEQAAKDSEEEDEPEEAVKSLAQIRSARFTKKEADVRIKSLAEIRAEKTAKEGPRSITVKSLAEIRAEKAVRRGAQEEEGEDGVSNRSVGVSRLQRKRQERAIYRPPTAGSQSKLVSVFLIYRESKNGSKLPVNMLVNY